MSLTRLCLADSLPLNVATTQLPSEYPFKPPEIYLSTPSGRFEVRCLPVAKSTARTGADVLSLVQSGQQEDLPVDIKLPSRVVATVLGNTNCSAGPVRILYD